MRIILNYILIYYCIILGVLTVPARAWSAQPDSEVLVTLSDAARASAGITVAPVQAGALSQTVQAMARVTAESRKMVTIHPAGSGKVLDVEAVPGQRVRQGDVLVTYQDHSLHLVRLQLAKASAALATAKAMQADARATYSRGKALAGGALSRAEEQRRVAALHAANDTVAARQADVDTLHHQLDEEYNSVTEADDRSDTSDDETSRIIAPTAGEVQTVPVGVADDITPSTPIVTMADLSHLWIATDVVPEDAAKIDPAAMQETTVPGRKAALRSAILSIASAADPVTGLVRVLSRVDNTAGLLRPGMILSARLPTRAHVTGLVLPAAAVVTIKGQRAVFVPDGKGRFRLRPVQVGLETPDQAVVTAGVKEGQPVVTQGAFALKADLLMGEGGG